MARDDYALRCPKCNKEISPEWTIGTRAYGTMTLDAPYFMCSTCRVIYIDKAFVRSEIHLWRTAQTTNQPIPLEKVLFKEIMEYLHKNVIDLYCRTASYRWARFKKIIS